ncbi:diguanylate cyclase domain-containing protein [Spongisporangium articulatum]|uniref:Diguanylate cyclase domain-containing protein n=1 Tax=Spongisporangium articulatum TaxID=3362603 RepID=A0ABW8AR25_9ACTN
MLTGARDLSRRRAGRALRRRGLASVSPVWAVSIVLVTLMVAATIGVGTLSLRAAKQDRVTERAQMLQKLLQYVEGAYDPAALLADAARVPLTRDDMRGNRRLLATFLTNSTGDPVTSVALYDRKGHLLTSRPSGVTPPTPRELGETWRLAADGAPVRSGAVEVGDETGVAMAVPVGGLRPWGVLVVTQGSRNSSTQRFVRDLGSLGKGPGGLILADSEGTAVAAWDPRLLSHRVVDPTAIDTLAEGTLRVTRSGGGAATTTTILYRSGDFTVLFRQRDALLYRDLEAGQRQRDLALVGVLALAVAGLLTVTVRRLREARRDRVRLHALLSGAHDLILVVGSDGRLSFVSPNLEPLLGYAAADWAGARLDDYLHPDDVPRLERLLADPASAGPARDVRLLTPAGDYRWFDLQAGDVSSEKLLTGVLLTCRDTGQRKELEDELFEQARRDPLTGLANRAVLGRELATRLSGRTTPRIGLLFVDLDGFKGVNDEHGHEAGDRLLVALAGRLRRLTRDDELVARYGGDEFVLVLGDGDEQTARETAQRVVDSLSRPVSLGTGRMVTIGASVGVAVAVPGLRSADALLRAADRAMYEAKHGLGQENSHIAVAPAGWLLDPDRELQSPGAPPMFPSADALMGGLVTAGGARSERARTPARESEPARQGRRGGGILPALVATGTAIVAVAGIGLWSAAQAQGTAEQQRIAERLDITGRVADYASVLAGADRLQRPVSDAPWALDGSLTDVLVLQAVLQSDLGGTGAQAGLYRTDGTLLTGEPGPALQALRPGTANFATAAGGAVAYVPYLESAGVSFAAYAIPIERTLHGARRTAAVLLVAQRLADSTSERLLQLLGSLGLGEGGISSVLPSGITTHSWSEHLIGRRAATAAQLASVRAGHPQLLDDGTASGQVTLAARMDIPSTADPDMHKYVLLQQPAASFYAGIRDRGVERNVVLLGGVLLCLLVMGLGGWQWSRQETRAHRRFNALLRNAHDIVLVLDPDDRIVFASSAMDHLLGRDPHSAIGRSSLDLVVGEDRARVTAFLDGRAGDHLQDVRLLSDDGVVAWFDLHRTDMRGDPDLDGVIVTCQEIGERKELRDQLAYLVLHDALTGLPNRARIQEALTEVLDATSPGWPRGGAGRGTWLLFVDLDRFKPVNDTFGHEAGDAVLRAVARRLGEAVQDVPGAVAGRLGGDEFALLLPAITAEEALQVADRVLTVVPEPVPLWTLEGRPATVGATVGLALAEPGDTPATLLARADRAMYRAKEAGRGRYAVHTD